MPGVDLPTGPGDPRTLGACLLNWTPPSPR